LRELQREQKPLTEHQRRAKEFFRKVEKDPKVAKWIEWHRRIRRGLMTENELELVRTKVSRHLNDIKKSMKNQDKVWSYIIDGYGSGEEVALHMTDMRSLDSILRTGFRRYASEMLPRDLNQLGHIGGIDLSFAPTTYRDVVYSNKYVEEYNPVTGKQQFTISGKTPKEFVLNCFKNLQALLGETAYTLTKPRAPEELTIIRKYYAKYKAGDTSFLNNKIELADVKEAFARFLAKRNYFTLGLGYGVEGHRSTMDVGLICPLSETYLDPQTGCKHMCTNVKPVGIFLINPASLRPVLDIMLRTAKSLDDIVPIYSGNMETGKTELIWPKKK